MTSTLRQAPLARGQGPEGWPRAVTEDLAYLRTAIVNVFFAGLPRAGDRDWVLIDAGMPGSARAIARAAERRFGRGARPAAIVMTHGHFDHVGALEELARAWDVPVYAHALERPYLTGRSPYPPPDPTVGGGLMAALSWMYPRGPIDLGDRVRALPEDGSVPAMPGWRWIHTPGHTAGHVSLFREADRALIAGDAFVTTKQESALAVLTQRPEVHGPPAYYTTDWEAAWRSVQELAALEPQVAATGHGIPLGGEALRAGLRALAHDFDRLAVPAHGRYVGRPALTDARGVVAVPPDESDPLPRLLLGFGAGIVAGLALQALFHPASRRVGSRGFWSS
jgi:glyoxylase-like metal-dependent hydrolase (beta-lactamase superfamily II)